MTVVHVNPFGERVERALKRPLSGTGDEAAVAIGTAWGKTVPMQVERADDENERAEVPGRSAGGVCHRAGVRDRFTEVPDRSAGVQRLHAGVRHRSAGVQTNSAGVHSSSARVKNHHSRVPRLSAEVQDRRAEVRDSCARVKSLSAGVPSHSAAVLRHSTRVQGRSAAVLRHSAAVVCHSARVLCHSAAVSPPSPASPSRAPPRSPGGQVQLTAAQNVALLNGYNLVKGFRTTVRGQKPGKEVLLAYGIGDKTNKASVSEVTAAIQKVLDRVADQPAEAVAFDFVEEDRTALHEALLAIEQADTTQEKARATSPQATAQRNITARRVLSGVKKIAGAGMRTFVGDATVYANFEALLSKAAG